MASNIYFYRMTTDNGGAPCVDEGLWSLAICKPGIRNGASLSDVVIGFAGNDIDGDNGIIHVARVTKVLPRGEYYDTAAYHSRGDCIYRRTEDDWRIVDNPFHELADMARDLGRARENTGVLLSSDFRYFGSQPFGVDWSRFRNLRASLDRLTRRERVHHSDEVLSELQQLVETVFVSTPEKAIGKPTHSRNCPCNRDDDEPDGVYSGVN